jgi:hypothetical protein
MDEQGTPQWPEFRSTPMSRERFEALLIEIRNGAVLAITAQINKPEEGTRGDARAVWHASEIALGILRPGYVPKREALHDVEAMLAWLDSDDDTWLGVD